MNIKHTKEIRKLWKEGKLTQGEIGKKFNVTKLTVSRIVRNKTFVE
jgi:DNA-directed RNA polymerase specialized sigma subunit